MLFEKLPPLVTAVVKSVDEDKALLSAELSMDEPGAVTGEITLNTVKGDNAGIILVPKVGARCILAAVDTDSGVYTLLRASEYDKIKIKAGDRTLEVKDGQWTFDGGSNGGLIKIDSLVEKLNNVENKMNDLIAVFLNHKHVSATSGSPTSNVQSPTLLLDMILPNTLQQLETTQSTQIENKKITH